MALWPYSSTFAMQDISSYFFREIDARNAFMIVADDENLTAQISHRIAGSLKNAKLNGNFDSMMDQLSAFAQADWFRSGNNIFISHKSERLTRYIKLKSGMSSDDAIRAITESNLSFDRFPIEKSGSNSIISVNAPPKYVAILETVLLSNSEKQISSPVSRGEKNVSIPNCINGKQKQIMIIKNGYRKSVVRCIRF